MKVTRMDIRMDVSEVLDSAKDRTITIMKKGMLKAIIRQLMMNPTTKKAKNMTGNRIWKDLQFCLSFCKVTPLYYIIMCAGNNIPHQKCTNIKKICLYLAR